MEMFLRSAITWAILAGIAIVTSSCQTPSVHAPPAVSVPVGDTVRAASFNIRIGYGTDDWGVSPYDLRFSRKELGPIIKALNSLQPDVIALQEVLGAGQAQQIAAGLGMDYAYAAHPDDWWGVAVLSRYPILRCSDRPVGGMRAVIICELGDAKRKISAASVHRDHRLFDGQSNKAILNFTNKYSHMILMGDFNFPPSGPNYDTVLNTYEDTAMVQTARAAEVREVGTYGFPFGRRIDYIFARGHEFVTADAGVADFEFRHASDHRAVFAELRFK